MIDESFINSLLERKRIDCLIEGDEDTYVKTLKAVETLLFNIRGFSKYSRIDMSLSDLEFYFSSSPFVKFDVIDMSREDLNTFNQVEQVEFLCRKIKNPNILLFSFVMLQDVTLDEMYNLGAYIKERVSKSSSREGDGVSTSFFVIFSMSMVNDEILKDSALRLATFWIEKD
jgi:hypothetical protein